MNKLIFFLLFCWSFYGFSQNNGKDSLSLSKENEFNINKVHSPFLSRYYLTNNALPIKKGEHYFMLHLWGPEVNFNITKSTSIGVMSTWIASPFGLSIKQNFKTGIEKLNFSIGVLAGSMGYLTQGRGYGGVFLGTATFGSSTTNISFSAGVSVFKTGLQYGFFDDVHVHVIDTINDEGGGLIITYERPKSMSYLFSVSGMKIINADVTLICDMIYSLSQISIPAESNIVFYGTFKDAKNSYTLNNFKRNYVVFMPSLRFDTGPKTSIQISLSINGSFDKYKKKVLPIPMLSWFKKF